MGFGHWAYEGMAGLKAKGYLGLQRPGISFCKAGFRCFLQTDYFRAVMVYYSAPVDDACIYDYFRQSCKNLYRWSPTFYFLSFGNSILGVFFKLSKRDIGYIYKEFQDFRQSLFPTINSAAFGCYYQSCEVWDTIYAFSLFSCLFH